MATTTLNAIEETIDRLARTASETDPIVSLYLDLRPDQHGRRRHLDFFERAMDEQIATFPSAQPARGQLEQSARRIRTFLESELQTSAKAVAVFSCTGNPELFEAIQLSVPIDGHRLYIDRQPHLFPLARVTDAYAKYAALVVDTHSARLFVFAVGALQRKATIASEKPTRTAGVDVFSEGEYQRNAENLHQRHMKEVARAIERVDREEQVRQVFVAASDAVMPLLRRELPAELEKKVVEISNVDLNTPDAEILKRTLEALKQTNTRSDKDDVARVLDAFRARGLGTIGLQRVRAALTLGQVDRLLLPAVARRPAADEMSAAASAVPQKVQPPHLSETVIEELVQMARRTDAAITFIDDPALLDEAGGVAAFLRFRLTGSEATPA